MYYTVMSYHYPDFNWRVSTVKVTVLEETNEYYVLESTEDFHVRSDKVYKTDDKDVASCGYFVLNYPAYGKVDLIEGFASCISLTKEEGKAIVKEALEKALKKKIDFFNNQLIALNNLVTID